MANALRVLTPEMIADYAIKGGFSNNSVGGTSDAVKAVAVALAESGGNVFAHNPTPPDDSYGLWQINMIGNLGSQRRAAFGLASNDALYDPGTNAGVAHAIKSTSGWEVWSTFKDGEYLAFVNTAINAVRNPQPDDGQSHGGPIAGGPDSTITQIDILKPLKDLFSWIVEQLKPFVLRMAGFVGGGVILIIGIILYVKGLNR